MLGHLRMWKQRTRQRPFPPSSSTKPAELRGLPVLLMTLARGVEAPGAQSNQPRVSRGSYQTVGDKPQLGRVIAILRNRPVRTKTRLLGRGMICGTEAGG